MDILSKKLLQDIPNAAVKFLNAWGDTGLQTTPANFSLCLTLKMTQAEFNGMTNYGLLIGQVNNDSLASPNCNYIYKVGAQFIYLYKSANLSSARAVYFPTASMAALLDGNAHKIVVITANGGTRIYVDGGRIANYTSSLVPTEFTSSAWNTSFRIGNHASSMQKGGTISNIKYFNFDISATGAAYTLDDYQNNRDIPDGISGVILNLHNKLSGTTWTDESGNGYNMTLSGDFEITDE